MNKCVKCAHCSNYGIILQQLSALRSQIVEKNHRISELENFIHRISRVAFVGTSTIASSIHEEFMLSGSNFLVEKENKVSRQYMEMSGNNVLDLTFKN